MESLEPIGAMMDVYILYIYIYRWINGCMMDDKMGGLKVVVAVVVGVALAVAWFACSPTRPQSAVH